jgi:hypothetical protein
MPYTKTYNYVDGATLSATGQNANDDGVKIYVNQDVVSSDYAADTFDTPDIVRGELDPINNNYMMTTGDVWGRFNDSNSERRSYFTAETKSSRTTQLASTSVQWQPIYESGDLLNLEHDEKVLITFGGLFVSNANEDNTKGKWDSPVYLVAESPAGTAIATQAATVAYTFEEAGSTPSAGVKNPGTLDLTDAGPGNRRWIGFSKMFSLTAGLYRLYVAVNPKVEQGFCSARQWTCEVFYA